METKELMAQNVQDPAQAGEVLLQPPKRPKKKRSIKKIVLLSLAGIAVLALAGNAVLSALRGPADLCANTDGGSRRHQPKPVHHGYAHLGADHSGAVARHRASCRGEGGSGADRERGRPACHL